MLNYYEILGIPLDADTDTIQRAMTKYAQNAQNDDDLRFLQECKNHLLDTAAREQYKRDLLQACPGLANAAHHPSRPTGTSPQTTRKQRETEQPSELPAVRPFFKILLGIPIFLLVGGILFSGKDKTLSLDEWGAQVACENAVSGMLKAPSTADFSGWQRSQNSDGSYTVTGSVDAQNSFGAMIRNQFSCKVRDKKDGTTGTIVEYLR